MAKGLTDKQRKILEYIIDFQKQNTFPPTIREVGDAFGIGSLRGVTVHLDALVRKSFITRERTSRSIRVTAPDPRDPRPSSGAPGAPALLPLIRDLPGGGGAKAGEVMPESYVSLPADLAEMATSQGFVLRLGATGMHREPLVPGDLLVVRPETGTIENELIVTRSKIGLTVCRAEGGDTDVVGRVVGLIRRY